jgi:pyruvyl transferase EpsO
MSHLSPSRSPTTASQADAHLFARYRAEIDALLDEYIEKDRPAALLQFPYDGNVGNHMMWVATTDYLKERGIALRYVAHERNFNVDRMRRVIGDRGTILFLGGVTVSRLWPRHAELKREVAQHFGHNPIVCLPSTVLFVDDEDRDGARTIFGDHRMTVVMTRDPVSEKHARAAFPEHVAVRTVPDLTLRLPLYARRTEPEHDVIWLARNDVERLMKEPPPDVHVFDWPYLHPAVPRAMFLLRTSGVLSRLRKLPPSDAIAPFLNRPITSLYRWTSLDVVRNGNELLDSGRVLVTDRLHPHILTALRGQPSVLLPDKFGKNRAVYDHFSNAFDSVHWADSSGEGVELARELAKSAGARKAF